MGFHFEPFDDGPKPIANMVLRVCAVSPVGIKGTIAGFVQQWKCSLEAYALQQPRLSARAVERNLHALAQTHGEKVPSYRTVTSVMASIDKGLMTLAHEGSKAYSGIFQNSQIRRWRYPNTFFETDSVHWRQERRKISVIRWNSLRLIRED